MEEYIYIILGVLWLVASIYRATKKGKKPISRPSSARPHEQEESRMPDARSLIEEFLGGQQPEVPEPFSQEISSFTDDFQEEEVKPINTFQSEYTRYGLKGLEGLSGEGEHAFGKITFEDQFKDVTKKKPGQNKIDLRKAIIYSAILERPYT